MTDSDALGSIVAAAARITSGAGAGLSGVFTGSGTPDDPWRAALGTGDASPSIVVWAGPSGPVVAAAQAGDAIRAWRPGATRTRPRRSRPCALRRSPRRRRRRRARRGTRRTCRRPRRAANTLARHRRLGRATTDTDRGPERGDPARPRRFAPGRAAPRTPPRRAGAGGRGSRPRRDRRGRGPAVDAVVTSSCARPHDPQREPVVVRGRRPRRR